MVQANDWGREKELPTHAYSVISNSSAFDRIQKLIVVRIPHTAAFGTDLPDGSRAPPSGTCFWVGEPSDKENAYIPNDCSYWDDEWMKHFGGVDDPDPRNGYHPAKFTPKQNPFYFALPYGERDDNDRLKENAEQVPWYAEWRQGKAVPLLKNRWIRIVHGRNECYAQWADVGPNEEDDWEWVFGHSTRPKSSFNQHAGLDLSPACWQALGMEDNDWTQWEFVDESAVPDGPWREIVTRG